MYGSGARPPRRWTWLPLIIAAGLVAVFALGAIAFGAGPASSVQGPWYGWWFPGWFVFVPVFFLLFFGLRWLVWGGWGWGWYQGGYRDQALETLRERFARGELAKEQFEQMRRDLEAARA